MKIALAQMLVEGGRPDANLARAVARIAEAAAQRCEVVVLPECLDLGWTDPSARDLAQPIPGTHFDRLAAAAREHQIHVVAGLVERSGVLYYNAAVLIGPDGRLLLQHRKINELDIAHDLYAIGDRLGVAHTPIGTIAINICADNFPESLAIGHTLARMGAQILLSPSAWAVEATHDNGREPYGALWTGAYRELGRCWGLPVVGVSSVGWLKAGPWQGRKLIGCSLAMAGDGRIVAQGPYGDAADCLLVADLPLRAGQ